MFKGIFTRSKENHRDKSKKATTLSNDTKHALNQSYLVLSQPFGKNFDVQVVFAGQRDKVLQEQQEFQRLCRLCSTEETARLAGKHLAAPNQYGVFKIAYPVTEVPGLIEKGLLSKIVMGGWASPYFNDEDYITNPNFEPTAADEMLSMCPPIADSVSVIINSHHTN